MELFGARERIIDEALTWDGVLLGQHRFGWVEIRVDRRAIGHLHGNKMVDILLPKDIRVEMVCEGQAEPHPVLPSSGWVTVYLCHPQDEARALRILRAAYDDAWKQCQSGPFLSPA